MNTKWIESFRSLPFEKREELFRSLSDKLVKAEKDNDGEKINRIEKSLTRILSNNWNTTATKAINKSIKTFGNSTKRFSKKDADRVLSSLTKSFNGIENKTKKRVEDDIKEIYEINKKRFGKEFKLSSPTASSKSFIKFEFYDFNPDKGIFKNEKVIKDWEKGQYLTKKKIKKLEEVFKVNTLGELDKAAYENLARLENVSIGDHFPNTLKHKVSRTLETALERGLNQADASEFLEQELTKSLGGNASGALPASVAAGKASTTAYFEMLNATNVTYARNFGQINLMSEVGIENLIFNAIIDRTTSTICSQMDGRIFTIEHAVEHQEKVLSAENVEQLKVIAPFTRNLSDFNLEAGKKLNDKKSSDALAEAGVVVPPLHGRCYDDITEVLTNTGWKLFKDVEPLDKIFSLNPDTLIPEYTDFRLKQEYPFSGEMVHLTNNQKSLDMMVTPDHMMFYFKRVDNGKSGRNLSKFYCEMDSFLKAGKEAKLYLSSKWEGGNIGTVDVCGLEMKPQYFCEFMGYYLSDGSTRSTGYGSESRYANIAQQIGSEKMFERLKLMGFKNVTRTTEKLHIYDTRVGEYCEQFGHSHEKFVPEIIKKMSPSNIRIFLDAFNSCDGSIKESTNFKDGDFENTKLYYTSSPQLASDLGELLIKVGKSCSYYLDKSAGVEKQFKNGIYTINYDGHKITEINSEFRVPRIVKRVPYNGIVYDLELKKNHIMLVRRNGKVVWGTNCRSELQPA